jgi:hypothetical protein
MIAVTRDAMFYYSFFEPIFKNYDAIVLYIIAQEFCVINCDKVWKKLSSFNGEGCCHHVA